ncbi:raffinose/stachyose/melibiose transport system permease protein [Microbacterium sp. AK009]|uniref:carbohydrate ABC transporter permease n=1 Tax=Microbacterium sp. AK009 TaxID=2723068 RepID=UPI0015CA0BE0|nr:sugar ABC transporter permease [Microbacterium sp. AK009]NYF16616.1 raffinose/stachyose/melibiose transport system permease protein [Microbacterium sp. AK009]
MATTTLTRNASSYPGQRRRTFRRRGRRSLTAYLFLAPAVLLYLTFVIRPTLELFGLSLYSWNGVSPTRDFVGFANFQRLFADPLFWESLRNNLVFVVILVSFNVIVGLVTASALARITRGRLIYQLIFFLPVVQASIVTALVWQWIYQPRGLLNELLRAVGLDDVARGWLGDPTTALAALALAAAWAGFGLSVVIFLAGLQGIDQTLYDAAKVDGANAFQSFWNVTVPELRPVITVVFLLEMIGAFQTFDIIWATTRGGPINSTEVLGTYMFKRGFTDAEFGYGAAIAVAFMIIVLVAAVISLLIRERNED